MLVFVEVRSRASDDLGTPAETVNARKQRRVAQAARAWLMMNPGYQGRAMRFDVVGITWDVDPPRIEHVVDAFDDQ